MSDKDKEAYDCQKNGCIGEQFDAVTGVKRDPSISEKQQLSNLLQSCKYDVTDETSNGRNELIVDGVWFSFNDDDELVDLGKCL